MAEYIEREAAISGLDELERTSYHNSVLWPDHVEECREALRSIPAANVQPVVRGKWKVEKEDVEWGCSTVRYRCSHCGRLPHFDKESFKFLLSDFCPKCGADMRAEEGER